MRVGIVRPRRDRAVATRQSLLESFELIQGAAAIGEGLCKIRPNVKRGIEARERFRKPPELMQRDAAVVLEHLIAAGLSPEISPAGAEVQQYINGSREITPELRAAVDAKAFALMRAVA